MQVTINHKKYTVPQLNFGHMTQMEEMGFSVIDMFKKKQAFALSTAFIGVVVGCEREDAEELAQQHVMGGGDIAEVYAAFMKAVDESDFFKKLLNEEEK